MCPQCSDREERCMLCGCHAPTAGNYVPAASVNPNPAPPGEAQIFVAAGRDRDSTASKGSGKGSNAPSRFTSNGGSFPPPPPPQNAPRTPSGKRSNDFDWLPNGNSPGGQGFAPPPPPPPRGQGRMQVPPSRQPSGQQSQGRGFEGGNWQKQQQQDRGYGPPGASGGRPGLGAPPQQPGGWSLQELQDKSASEHMNNLFGYLQSLQIPTVDIASWASCMNAQDFRYNDEVNGSPERMAPSERTRQSSRAPPGAEPRPWRGGA